MSNDFDTRTLPLRNGSIATLVRVPADGTARGAILYVHGFADYFFQRHVAEHFTEQGYDFYAVDLRHSGRSLREGDLPHFILDLSLYYEELDAAAEMVRGDGHTRFTVMGHSTGGLITPLWLDARKDLPVDGLVLNSPWFELAEPWPARTVGTVLIKSFGLFFSKLELRKGLGGVYGQSIHKGHHGEWEFDLKLKPLNAFPVLMGWLRAVRIGQARLQAGLDIRVPVLVMHSGRSLLHTKEWTPAAMTADTVLDVADMVKFAPKLGRDVTVVAIPDGLHDLFLSAEPARTKALTEVDAWLASQSS
nr:alpha/beta hydrolase [Kibdelosporangium sp. MJ126-NF4]CEL16749.1 Lysophospholipase [Kibdelosporangium sp. MJ126-NF4]CTQ92022.1 Lysophospholipase (EC 3.1.1.5) [Kibdelosporangium sp. MJ126-NF4]